MKRFDVVVVGARCAGSPVALMLARRGLSVCLVDRAQFPSETPSTHLIQPCGVQLLDQLGVLDAVLAAGAVQLDHMTMVIDDAVRIEAMLDEANGAHASLCVGGSRSMRCSSTLRLQRAPMSAPDCVSPV